MLNDPGRPPPTRRSPYGANPTLGRHGTRARREILEAARRLFAEHGYHGTTVEAIGEESGRSGASVYQYFECKAAIFGVLADEVAEDVLAAARELGADPQARLPGGFARHVGRLSEVFARHAATFVTWPVAEQSEPSLRGTAMRFHNAFAETIRPWLDAAGVPADRQRPLAIGLGALVQSAHSTRHARLPALGAEVLDDVLAGVVYRALHGPVEGPPPPRAAAPPRVPRPATALAPPDPVVVPGVRRRLTPRSISTVDRILAAATTVFRRKGFLGASVNDLAAEAGVSHGSVYTYWPDLGSLFVTLAHRAAVALSDHIETATTGFGDPTRACAWLERWLDVVTEHGVVLQVWAHEATGDGGTEALARDMERYVTGLTDVVLRSGPTAGTLDAPAARAVVRALLVDLPYTHHVQLETLSRQETLDVLSALLLRGVLGLSGVSPTRR